MDEGRETFKRWFHERYSDAAEMPEGDTEEWLSFSAALAKAGLKVVGREPTEAQCLAAYHAVSTLIDEARDAWRAMWDAADPTPHKD